VKRRAHLSAAGHLLFDGSNRCGKDAHGHLTFFRPTQPLHPQNASEIFVDASRALALSTAGKKFSGMSRQITAEHELIGAAPTTGTSFASQFSSYGPDLPQLFLHEVLQAACGL